MTYADDTLNLTVIAVTTILMLWPYGIIAIISVTAQLLAEQKSLSVQSQLSDIDT